MAKRAAMKPMTARELKNATGEVVRTLRRGQSILLSFRGKPLATIEPIHGSTADRPVVPPYDEAWAEIEAQLSRSTPAFASWRDAEDYTRARR